MPTSEERLAIVEQTVTTLRNDFLQAIVDNTRSMTTLNKVILHQEENLRDADHEITILTGVVGSQGRDIKAIKERLDGFDLHFTSQGRNITAIKDRVEAQEQGITAIKDRVEGFDQRFTSLEGKLDQVLQILARGQ